MANQNGSERRVRTTEGARFFGVPVGSEISPRSNPQGQTTRSMSMVRLISLQRQFLAAKRVGNLSAMRDAQDKFTSAVREYAATNGQLNDVLSTLVAARGRADQAVSQETKI